MGMRRYLFKMEWNMKRSIRQLESDWRQNTRFKNPSFPKPYCKR